MTLQLFYEQINGSYEQAINRLLKEERIKKYLLMFKDSQNIDDFAELVKEEKWEDAFRFMHTLKGVALNLELGDLAIKSSELCEMLRHGKPDHDISVFYQDVKLSYNKVIELINQID